MTQKPATSIGHHGRHANGERRTRRTALQAAVMIVVLWAVSVAAGAQDALPPSQWRLRFLAISCRSAPCPDWQVQDRKTGEWFPAVVRFENAGDARHAQAVGIGTVDLLADGERSEQTMSGRRYTSMVISRVVGEAPTERPHPN